MSATGARWPRWLSITLLVLAAVLVIPLGWMLCAMTFGGGMMSMGEGMMGSEMMGGGMMGMHWAGLVGLALLIVLLVALIVFGLRHLARGKTDEPPSPPGSAPNGAPTGPHRPQ